MHQNADAKITSPRCKKFTEGAGDKGGAGSSKSVSKILCDSRIMVETTMGFVKLPRMLVLCFSMM